MISIGNSARKFWRSVKSVVRSQSEGDSDYPSFEQYQEAEIKFYDDFIKPGMLVFDLGANVGTLTRTFLLKVGKGGAVHAFEPHLPAFKQLSKVQDDFEGYSLKINNCAVSDRIEELWLHVYDDEYSCWNSLAKRPVSSTGRETVGRERVSSTTLDQYLSDGKIDHIDLLKVDVEGAEYQVFVGAANLMSQRKVKCVVFECGATTSDMGNNVDEIERLLLGYGYSVRNLIPSYPAFEKGCGEQLLYSMVVSVCS